MSPSGKKRRATGPGDSGYWPQPGKFARFASGRMDPMISGLREKSALFAYPLLFIAALVCVGLVLVGVIPGGTVALQLELGAVLVAAVSVYAFRRWKAQWSVGPIRVLAPTDAEGKEGPLGAELVVLVESELALCGLALPATGGAPPLPPLGPVLAATDEPKGKVIGGLIDQLTGLLQPPTGHDLALTVLPPGSDGLQRLGMRLTDRVSGEADISKVVSGVNAAAVASEVAFETYFHALRHRCDDDRLGHASAWANAENLSKWVRLRESRDEAALRALARSEPANAAVRFRLAQILNSDTSREWTEGLECYAEILAAGDDHVRLDVLLRIAILLSRKTDHLTTGWQALDRDSQRRLWGAVRTAAGASLDDPPEDLAHAVTELRRGGRSLCQSIEATTWRRRSGKTWAQVRDVRQTARMVRAMIETELPETGMPEDVAANALRPLPHDIPWRVHYNAACLICRAGLDLPNAQEHVVAVVTDPDWRQVKTPIAEERQRWLFCDDPDLKSLRDDAGSAGRDFRDLAKRLGCGAVLTDLDLDASDSREGSDGSPAPRTAGAGRAGRDPDEFVVMVLGRRGAAGPPT